jgi:hypothetical protein
MASLEHLGEDCVNEDYYSVYCASDFGLRQSRVNLKCPPAKFEYFSREGRVEL